MARWQTEPANGEHAIPVVVILKKITMRMPKKNIKEAKNKGSVYDDNVKREGVNHRDMYGLVCFLVCLPSCPESEPKLSAVSALATSASF